ncbi:MAG: DUF308 domain-containing protein [Rikenellaceae bacterium]|nr:DUF308 domain-containing protein [Rikenellaceae bacterium]
MDILKIFDTDVWRSIIAVLIGIVMIVWSHIAVNYAIIITGILVLLSGIASIFIFYRVDKTTRGGLPVEGILSSMLGVLLIAVPSFFASIIMILLGAILVVAAVNQLSGLVLVRRNGFRVPGLLCLFPFVILTAGIIILFNPFATAQSLVVFFGCAVLLYGIINIVNYYILRRQHE